MKFIDRSSRSKTVFLCIKRGAELPKKEFLTQHLEGEKIHNSQMANIWDFNCCGEFKATMKIIQAIFDLGELEKAAKQGKIIRRFLVCSLSKTGFWIFRTSLCSFSEIQCYIQSDMDTFCTNLLQLMLIKFSSVQALLRLQLYPLWTRLIFSHILRTVTTTVQL